LTLDSTYEDSVFNTPTFFRLYDTPGADSEKNTLESAQIIRVTLTLNPINLIIINAKLDSRYNKTLKKFKEQLTIFKGYEKYVVFLASCLDLF
jgi:hypothetical protein